MPAVLFCMFFSNAAVAYKCLMVTLLNDCWNHNVKFHSTDKFVCSLNLVAHTHTQARIPCSLKCRSAAAISFLLTKLLSKAIASAKSFFFFFLSSGSKWQLNRLDWAFVWALTEAFYLHAHKPNARYSWLAAETWSSSFLFFFWSRPIFIYYQKKWERETAMVFSFARGFISFSDSHCWEVSKCQRMEHGVFSKHLSTCSHAKNSAIMTNSSGRMTNYSYILWITVVFFKRFSFFQTTSIQKNSWSEYTTWPDWLAA